MSPNAFLIRCISVVALIGAAPALAAPQPLAPAEIDRLVARTMTTLSVPGMAVGIVKDGQLVFAKGYGVRELGRPERVDADTQFAIGSNTKAFTTAALAMLVDAGKLHWDDRVIDFLPDFRMFDPYVTREFRVRDLLTHRSGLGVGAGDLLFVTRTDFTRTDVVRALRYLKPVTSFRSQFAYDNLLYVVAGELVAAVSGLSWEDFIESRILTPLKMQGCTATDSHVASTLNVAAPHAMVGGQLAKIGRLEIPLAGPAGAIQCNVTGMARWLATQLGRGKSPDGVSLFSAQQSEEMWTPQTILKPHDPFAELTHTHFASYGLGWGLDDVDGFKRVSHNGGLPGMVTHVGLIPELNLGVVVLTNQQQGLALSAVALSILEGYLGVPPHDWVSLARHVNEERAAAIRTSDAAHAPVASVPAKIAGIDLAAYTGTFVDPWRGNVTISRQGDGLRLSFSHTDALTGPLTPLSAELFVVRWDNRALDADAYVRFTTDFSGTVLGFTMKAVSASTDFSYDFQDLDFRRAADAPAVH